MDSPASRRELQKYYEKAPPEVQSYFKELPRLLESFSLDVALAYVFSRVELAHNMALDCGVVRLHHVNREVARPAIDASHMKRETFTTRFEVTFAHDLPAEVQSLLGDAELTRDRVMHGKRTNDPDKRAAIAKVIGYAIAFNRQVFSAAGFRPFGDLRGFHGRAESLSKATSRWVLKGMGFNVQ